MTALAGIEVLGALTSRTKCSGENGADRFGEFWRDYVYVERRAFQRLDSLVYQMVRHGLAHAFLTKPMIRVTKHRDPNHLHRVKGGAVLILDALTLADDFATAYRQRLRPQITGDLKSRMETRFQEFLETYWQDHVDWKGEFEKAPVGTEPLDVNLFTRKNSAAYSTSVLRANSPTIPHPQNLNK